MTQTLPRFLFLALVGSLTLVAGPAAAQSGEGAAARVDARDSLFLRARQLVLEGNGGVGRAIVDSVLAASADTPAYPDALYWRGALAATAADAERDYRRVIVEYPFSRHAGDALLALAQLEMARGDRAPAIDHLQRFLLQRADDPDRIRASIWLGRLLLESNQVAKGCAVLLRTRATLASDAVEIRNQVDYQASRCAGIDTTSVAATPSRVDTPRAVVRPQPDRDRVTPTRPPPSAPTGVAPNPSRPPSEARPSVRDSVRHDSSRTSAAARYTVQVAAYDTKDAADQLIARLAARGISARLVGGPKAPFRVRVGRFTTEAEASAAATDLKAKGITVFVTTTDIERATPAERR